MLKNTLCAFLIIFSVFLLFSCSDGMQVSQKISVLIDHHQPSSIVVEVNHGNGNIVSQKYPIDSVKMEHQFLQLGNDYLNLDKVKSIRVKDKQLKLIM